MKYVTLIRVKVRKRMIMFSMQNIPPPHGRLRITYVSSFYVRLFFPFKISFFESKYERKYYFFQKVNQTYQVKSFNGSMGSVTPPSLIWRGATNLISDRGLQLLYYYLSVYIYIICVALLKYKCFPWDGIETLAA